MPITSRLWLPALLLLPLAGLSQSCRSHRPPDAPAALFPRAIITPEHIREAAAFEAELAKRYDQPAPAAQPWFQVLPGGSKVMVVASRATSQVREGGVKPPDAGTGSLAVMLNRLAGCPAIYTT